MASSKRFGYEWRKYNVLNPDYESQFLKWIAPFQPNDFKNKSILDAGCGMGRNTFWALKYGASRAVAFDADNRTVQAAEKTLSVFNNVSVLLQSIYDINFENQFDIAFSIGVIHHLKKPQEALLNLKRSLKPGGVLMVWVYGYEGNEWIVKYINPLRKNITSKMPASILHFLAYLFTAPLWLSLRIMPFKSPYLRQIRKFKFWHLHAIVFDQLLPEIANYYTKEQALKLFEHLDLENVRINRCNENSWTIYGYKPAK